VEEVPPTSIFVHGYCLPIANKLLFRHA